jgi:hypothetical protein
MTAYIMRDVLRHAAGTVTWVTPRVHAGRGDLGLRPALAPMEGPNLEAQARRASGPIEP